MDIRDRFFKSVNKTSGCWIWTGALNQAGYGWISRTRKLGPTRAHRLSYEIHVGEIGDGLHVLHRCDNRKCVNPEHLYLGTQADNVRDMVERNLLIRGAAVSWAKLIDKDVIAIRASTEPQDILAARYGVCQQNISRIVTRKSWKHIP